MPRRPRAAEAPAVPALSLAVQYGKEEPRLPRWRLRRWIARALRAPELAGVAGVALTLRLVGSAEGRRLNREFRQRDYATNVLTFEYGAGPDGVVGGDIVLCLPVLAAEAKTQKKPFLHHAAHLVVHGVLHSLGYDHLNERDAKRMEALETRILAEMAIPDPYRVS
ncbi:rRNA maturation RNase YbeY [Pigmentiphaga sp. NML080357]|uniref:rRNA maturation RNase YbeY n=1 Tax=Pigmentiphaga sp. NML080357 TaxID=2008675 RepID=UPI000B41E649|nr:rRNA maturation RNase YbeY [Pigmentiphaga sp. NML080357]OVZ57567.1 rRNA maturation RNase YbeY [Pigmentiphaga sp. NML080357]